ncbi:hypothetical protein H2203_008197 [Taxawa tesnikishii (nom. ined.)]|nr:hypothetical protein H2203_008197 [Dothideales sp. JES 119]
MSEPFGARRMRLTTAVHATARHFDQAEQDRSARPTPTAETSPTTYLFPDGGFSTGTSPSVQETERTSDLDGDAHHHIVEQPHAAGVQVDDTSPPHGLYHGIGGQFDLVSGVMGEYASSIASSDLTEDEVNLTDEEREVAARHVTETFMRFSVRSGERNTPTITSVVTEHTLPTPLLDRSASDSTTTSTSPVHRRHVSFAATPTRNDASSPITTPSSGRSKLSGDYFDRDQHWDTSNMQNYWFYGEGVARLDRT